MPTAKDFNEMVRKGTKKGSVTDGELSDADMNQWLRSGGKVVPEKKAPHPRQLTPQQAVEALEAMSASGMTFSQAKAKILADEARKESRVEFYEPGAARSVWNY